MEKGRVVGVEGRGARKHIDVRHRYAQHRYAQYVPVLLLLKLNPRRS